MENTRLSAARVFYISLVLSNARRVLSQCNTRLRLLYLLIIGTEANCFEYFDYNNPVHNGRFYARDVNVVSDVKAVSRRL